MTQTIETYLCDLLTSASLPSSPPIFAGTTAEIRAPENHAVIVIVDSCDVIVKTLHRANIRIAVSSPTDSRAAHVAIVTAIKAAMAGTLPSSLVFSVGGFCPKTHHSAATDDGRWVSSLEGIFGFSV